MNSRATVSGVQTDAPVAIGELEVHNHLLGDLEAWDPAWMRDGYWFFKSVLERDDAACLRAQFVEELEQQGSSIRPPLLRPNRAFATTAGLWTTFHSGWRRGSPGAPLPPNLPSIRSSPGPDTYTRNHMGEKLTADEIVEFFSIGSTAIIAHTGDLATAVRPPH